MNMAGMMARSTNLSAVNCEASLVKTVTKIKQGLVVQETVRTQAGCEEGHIQIGGELLHLCREHALTGNNVTRQAHTDNFQDGLEY